MPLYGSLNLYYPSGGQAPDFDKMIKDAVASIHPHLVFSADDEADRDARYGAEAASTLVVSATLKKIWLKVGSSSSSWIEIFSDTGWFSPPLTWNTGWDENLVRARQIGSQVTLEIYANRTGPDIVASSTGSISDELVFTIGTPYRPSHKVYNIARTSSSGGELQMEPNGQLKIPSLNSNSIFAQGQNLSASLVYLVN